MLYTDVSPVCNVQIRQKYNLFYLFTPSCLRLQPEAHFHLQSHWQIGVTWYCKVHSALVHTLQYVAYSTRKNGLNELICTYWMQNG